MTYVNVVKASKHNENIVFAAFNNHKRGDFKPYLLKSEDKGKTWVSIAGDLPERGSVYSFEQDFINPNIIFAGTEFGVFVTLNGGIHWVQLKAGLPTIAIRDMEIQKRENDLVLASFGRGFYVLDDYSSLRELADEKLLDKKFHLFDIKKGLMFNETNPLGYRGKNAQGESYYAAENPPVGSVITYYFSDTLKTMKEIRQDAEKLSDDDFYPTKEQIRKEAAEEKAFLLFVIKDENGNEVQKIKADAKAGINKIVWNFRYTSTTPIKLKVSEIGRYGSPDVGPLALPGKYTVTAYLANHGKIDKLSEPKSFEIELLNNQSLPAADKKALLSFQHEVSEIRRAVRGSDIQLDELKTKLKFIKEAVQNYPNVDVNLLNKIKEFEEKLTAIGMALYGDTELAKHEFETYPGIVDRIEIVVDDLWNSTSAPTTTAKENIKIASEEYAPVSTDIIPFKVQISITLQDLYKYRVNKIIKKLWSLYIVSFIFMIIFFISLHVNQGINYFLLIIPFITVILPFWLKKMTRRHFNLNSNQYTNIKYEFTEDSIFIDSDGFKSSIEWKMIQYVELDSNFVLLYRNKLLAHLIPLRYFNDKTQVDNFIEMVNRRI